MPRSEYRSLNIPMSAAGAAHSRFESGPMLRPRIPSPRVENPSARRVRPVVPVTLTGSLPYGTNRSATHSVERAVWSGEGTGELEWFTGARVTRPAVEKFCETLPRGFAFGMSPCTRMEEAGLWGLDGGALPMIHQRSSVRTA